MFLTDDQWSKIGPMLKLVMPGVVWKKWKPFFVPETEGLIETWVTKVQDYLNNLPDWHSDTISSRRLKKEVKAYQITPSTWKRITRAVAEKGQGSKEDTMGDGPFCRWRLEGSSLVRVTAEACGFTKEVAKPQPLLQQSRRLAGHNI